MDDRPRHPDDEPVDEGFRVLGSEGDDADAPDADAPADPNQFGTIPVIRPDEPPTGTAGGEERTESTPAAETGSGAAELPHWTDPPTGDVPRIFASESDDDLAAWSTVSSAQPRWRDQATDWDDSDLSALGEDLPPMTPDEDPATDDDAFFTFDDDAVAGPETYTVPRDPSEPHGGRSADPYADTRTAPPSAGRDMGQAVVVGVGIAALAGVLLWLGPAFAMALVVAVLVLASAELFSTLRRVGYNPPTLVGLAAVATLPLAAYWRGEPGIVLGIVLALAVGLVWYLMDIGGEHAVPNLGVTYLTIVYVGVLGAFAALLLRSPDGVGMLLAAVIGTVAYDVAGLFIGRSMGRAPLSVASPNKTVEGTIGGMVLAVLATVVITGRIAPFDSFGDALLLGLVLAVVAPLGDLCESMLKRDLGVKDMGNILPGHGGLLDRFDALLFALPATYYVARLVL